MRNAVGRVQRIVVLGGTSQIAQATVAALTRDADGVQVTLAARASVRRDAAVTALTGRGMVVDAVNLDLCDPAGYQRTVEEVCDSRDDVDIVLVAFGVLGDQERAWQDLQAAAELVQVNYAAAVGYGVLMAARLRAQGHGTIIALSSVASERPRRSNFVYGSTKAGMDAFYLGLGEAVADDGVRVMVVRPGFVVTRMTAGLSPAPLSQTPEQVAEAIVAGLQHRARIVWAPSTLRWAMSGLRHLPHQVFRRLPM